MSENEKNRILNDHSVSTDEMKAISGGVVFDWNAKCEATVENGSSCIGTDACYGVNVKYYRDKAIDGCSASVEKGSWCGSNDRCSVVQIRYEECASDVVYNVED